MRETEDKRLALLLICLWSMGIFFIAILVIVGYFSLSSDGDRLRRLALFGFAAGVPMYWATVRLANFYEGPSHHRNKFGHTLVYMVYVLPFIWLVREYYWGEGGDPGAIKAIMLFAMMVGATFFTMTILDRHRYLEHKEKGLL